VQDKQTKYLIFFACGASMKVNSVLENKVGSRLVVGTSPHQNHQRPQLDGKNAPCPWACPSTIKLSGRKFWPRGTFESGQRGMMMTCKITAIEEVDPS